MKRIAFVVVVVALLAVARGCFFRTFAPTRTGADSAAAPGDSSHTGSVSSSHQEHFSPAENLEQLDLAELARAHSSIEIAMYAFTDHRIADALLRTSPTVTIRLYRDGGQFQSEQQHATFSEPSTTQMLAGRSRIHIRIKQGDSRDLMHSKEFLVDGIRLRDGSANWSQSALRFQDNSWLLLTDPSDIEGFRRHFEEMWSRPSNLIVQ